MNTPTRRIAVSLGHGYTSGLNAVIMGAVIAAEELGWEVVGIHDGFEGLLFPERYPDGGTVKLDREIVAHLGSGSGPFIGTAGHTDPFRVRTVNSENMVEEKDRSDDLLATIRSRKIEAVIAVAGTAGLGGLWKLSRKGLKTVCVPKAEENDIALTMLSFGFNSALSFTVELLERAREAAQSARQIGVVEVPGHQAGWLALQAGIAVCADAVLIPEIPYDLATVARRIAPRLKSARSSALIVVAEGGTPAGSGDPAASHARSDSSLKASLSPLATGEESEHVILRSGQAAQMVARGLQRLTGNPAYPLVLGQLVKGGPSTAVDRQLGLCYGAGAVGALNDGADGIMLAFQPPDLKTVPLAEAVNRVRTVPPDSLFVKLARSLGICLGNR